MTQRTPEQAVRAAQHSFVLEWGRMSSSWGINPTMAQIHPLLFISEEPMAMDDIIDRLGISRGNASMNLRDLIDWVGRDAVRFFLVLRQPNAEFTFDVDLARSRSERLIDIAVQPDGKILLAGGDDFNINDAIIVRLHPVGSLD